MNEEGKVRCPACGAEMNRHAEKLDQSPPPTADRYDAELGGVLVEFHTCPACTFVLEKPAV